MAPNMVKVKLLEEGSHLGRKGDIVAVPETLVPHLVQLRQQHDGTKLVPYRLACLADEAEAQEAAPSGVVAAEDVAHMTQAEAEAAGVRVVGGSSKDDVGAVSQVAAEKRAAEAESAEESEEAEEAPADSADESEAGAEGAEGADEAPGAAEAPKGRSKRKRNK